MTELAPFESPAELLDAQIAASRLAILAAAARAIEGGWLTAGAVAPPPDVEAHRARAAHALATRLERTREAGVDAPLPVALERLALSATEAEVAWLLVACELEPGLRIIAHRLSPEPTAELTLEVLRHIVYRREARTLASHELGPDGRLWRAGLLVEVGPTAVGGWRRPVRIADRVVTLAEGTRRFDPTLARLGRFALDAIPLDAVIAPDDRRSLAREAIAGARSCVIAVGPTGAGRRTLLAAAARGTGRAVIEIDATRLGAGPELAVELAQLARECTILDALPLIRRFEALAADATSGRSDRRAQALDIFASFAGPVLITATGAAAAGVGAMTGRPVVVVELDRPRETDRIELWRSSLVDAPEVLVERAASFPLTVPMIRAAAATAVARAASRRSPPEAHDVRAGLRSALEERFAGLATRIDWNQSWDDLVLPDEQLDQVAELLARIRHRRKVFEEWGFAGKLAKGLGVSALFSGPPGTGKTMVAGLLAGELGVDLYQVDLSRVVSKWIGETEKNLGTLFDAAESGAAILLFDEADSMFGKRTEVRSSNDRYANLEVNYLLQRLEAFTGITLLTTNHETAIDPAFRRRIAMHVQFPVPEVEERARLWRALLPASAEVDPDVDFGSLATRFEISGGYIRNAILRAAFFAADEDSIISSEHLVLAAQLEIESMGRVTVRVAA